MDSDIADFYICEHLADWQFLSFHKDLVYSRFLSS